MIISIAVERTAIEMSAYMIIVMCCRYLGGVIFVPRGCVF
ncbi:hypothetical protein D3OALGA1CA_2293 [Olavius algarvensis associated proteobacterium Delta 3]|nr:hypothetical protein D3OALGA1CA_2293 [Olavius algarvensis associated proteobacterium Delta 3]